MPRYSIERALGGGAEGSVFLVKNKAGQKFAMKAYTTCQEEKFKIEQEFNKAVVRKYPGKFMRIVQSDNVTISDKQLHLLPQGTCRLVIYETVDRILGEIMTSLPKNALYSIIIQIIDAVQVMHEKGYLHGDLHPWNIGLIIGEKEEIKLSNKTKIPSHGYRVKIIDYGYVRSIGKSKSDRYFYNYEFYDTIRIIICPWNNSLWAEEHQAFVKNPEINDTLLDGYDDLLSKFTRTRHKKILLMKILFPQVYLHRVFGIDYERKFKPTLPMIDLLFVLQADKNQELIMRYFQYRLAEC